ASSILSRRSSACRDSVLAPLVPGIAAPPSYAGLTCQSSSSYCAAARTSSKRRCPGRSLVAAPVRYLTGAMAAPDKAAAMGRYLEDFPPGETIKHWPGRTIRDFDDTWFTLMTMNSNPLHLDDHFASQSQHGRCLVNGTLVFALAVGMSVRDV